MKRIYWFLAFCAYVALFSHDARAQPGVCWTAPGGGGKSSTCPATGSPTIQAYVAAFNTFLNATWPTIFALPQPKIPNDLELVGASASYIENCPTTGTCVYNSATIQEAFVANILKKSGASGVVWNRDYMPYMVSTEYTTATGFSCTATYSAATCTRLTTNLAFYDAMDKYLASNGYTIRLAPISFGVPGGGNPWTICGLAPSTMTVAQRITCEKPYLAAMVAHMHALSPSVTATTIIAAHEPVEVDATSTGQTLSVADWHTLLAGLCPGIHAATGGSGITCSSGYSMADGAYVTNVTSSVPSGMQALGLDVYFRSFDSTPSWSNQPGVYQGWASSAIGAGLQVQIDEAGPPGYCPNGSGVGCNGNLIWGCAGPQMETYNANGAFSSWLFRWASAIGATVATLFNTGPMSLLQNGSCTDTSTSGYTYTMLNSIPSVPTITGYEWLAASRWGRQTRQGKTVVSGKIVQ